jgi:hypothetical protein
MVVIKEGLVILLVRPGSYGAVAIVDARATGPPVSSSSSNGSTQCHNYPRIQTAHSWNEEHGASCVNRALRIQKLSDLSDIANLGPLSHRSVSPETYVAFFFRPFTIAFYFIPRSLQSMTCFLKSALSFNIGAQSFFKFLDTR